MSSATTQPNPTQRLQQRAVFHGNFLLGSRVCGFLKLKLQGEMPQVCRAAWLPGNSIYLVLVLNNFEVIRSRMVV